MRYTVRHVTTYCYSEPAAVCHNEVRLAPRLTEWQTPLSFALAVRPAPSFRCERTDYFGNMTHHFAISDAHRELVVTAESEVIVRARPEPGHAGPPWEEAAQRAAGVTDRASLVTRHCAMPSSRVEAIDALREYAAPSFPPGRPVLEAARELTARIHTDFEFDDRATDVLTPTAEVLQNRRGVCQDFAHLAIGGLRSLGLPARYVSGYVRTIPPPGEPRLAGADASHAWLSAYCGPLGWIDLDPTNNCLASEDHITLAWGRDYADVCPIQGVFVGGGAHTVEVGVDVAPAEEAALGEVRQQAQQ